MKADKWGGCCVTWWYHVAPLIRVRVRLKGYPKLSLALAMVIDPSSGFDPWTLLPFSPELGALTVVRAPAPDLAGEAAAALARAGAGFILLMGEVPEHWLGPLESAVNRSGTVLMGVLDTPGRAFAHAA